MRIMNKLAIGTMAAMLGLSMSSNLSALHKKTIIIISGSAAGTTAVAAAAIAAAKKYGQKAAAISVDTTDTNGTSAADEYLAIESRNFFLKQQYNAYKQAATDYDAAGRYTEAQQFDAEASNLKKIIDSNENQLKALKPQVREEEENFEDESAIATDEQTASDEEAAASALSEELAGDAAEGASALENAGIITGEEEGV